MCNANIQQFVNNKRIGMIFELDLDNRLNS